LGWLAAWDPGEIARHDVDDHGDQHQEHSNPEDPAVMNWFRPHEEK